MADFQTMTLRSRQASARLVRADLENLKNAEPGVKLSADLAESSDYRVLAGFIDDSTEWETVYAAYLLRWKASESDDRDNLDTDILDAAIRILKAFEPPAPANL